MTGTTRDRSLPDSVRAPGAQVPLTDSLIRRMERIEGVRAAYLEVTFPATVRANGREIPVSGEAIPMAFASIAAYQPVAGRFFADSSEAAVLLSPSMTERIGYARPEAAVGDTVRLVTASLNFQALRSVGTLLRSGLHALPMGQRPYRVRVAGILSETQQPLTGLTRALVPLGFARTLQKVTFFSTLDLLFRNAETRSGYAAVRVQCAPQADMARVRTAIERMGVYTTSFREQYDRLQQVFLVLDLALGIIGAIALLVATLGIVNTILMNVRERVREIGIMMAVGGDPADLQRLFVVESATLGALGGAAGLVLGGLLVVGLDAGVNAYLDTLGLPPVTVFAVSPGTALGIFAGAVLISLLAGVAPARRAARIDPAEALRTV
jgi:putative ABC transport system permease protein